MALVGIALLITGIILNWQLGLVMLACVPFIGGSVAVLSMLMSSSTQEGNDHYAKAGGVATEVRTYVCAKYSRFIKRHVYTHAARCRPDMSSKMVS